MKENNTVKSSIHTNLNIDNNKIIDNLAESLNLIEIDKYKAKDKIREVINMLEK